MTPDTHIPVDDNTRIQIRAAGANSGHVADLQTRTPNGWRYAGLHALETTQAAALGRLILRLRAITRAASDAHAADQWPEHTP